MITRAIHLWRPAEMLSESVWHGRGASCYTLVHQVLSAYIDTTRRRKLTVARNEYIDPKGHDWVGISTYNSTFLQRNAPSPSGWRPSSNLRTAHPGKRASLCVPFSSSSRRFVLSRTIWSLTCARKLPCARLLARFAWTVATDWVTFW